ncbi:MAG: phosphotransferase [Dehalococcoidia bacterium]|nr:phosphotransferase [Dehalococcoidia bacterium]
MHLPQAPDDGSRYGAADIHIHSGVGDGMADVPQILEYVEEKTDLDVIAITDHDKIEGSYQARELAAKRGYRFELVTGMEVTTLEGHLLALFIESPVPSLKPLANTIEAIHAQGGLCIVPHPMSWLTNSISKRNLERILANGDQGIYLDGIETINSTIAGRICNRRARRFNEKHGLAETGGSDAHFLIAVGSALTLFPGRSVEELRRGILERKSRAQNGIRVGLRNIGFTQIIKQQRKSGGYSVRSILRKLLER